MASSGGVLRSIGRRAASCNWVGRSFNWGFGRAISQNLGGSPMRVFNRSMMSTVSERILPAAATAAWLMLPPSFEYGGNMFNKLFKVGGTMNYNFYSPADNKVISVGNKRSSIGEEKLKLRSEKKAVLVGSSHGWLASYKSRYNLDLSLYNPLSHRHIKLPPVETIPPPQEKLRDWGRPIKVVLSSSPDDDSSSNPCRAIMSFGPRYNMALCQPGRSAEWTPFGARFHENDEISKAFNKDRVRRAYEDFVYSTTLKQLFCVTQFTDFESWDLGDDPNSPPNLIWKKAERDFNYDEETYPLVYKVDDACTLYKYLVFAEHSNQLFLVRRHVMLHMAPDGSPILGRGLFGGLRKWNVPYMTVAFDVHLVDREKGELKFMDATLDGMSFFIGSNGHGFVVESPETMNLKPNSIYFTDSMAPPYWDKYKTYGGHDIGIFHYGKRTFSPCYYPFDINQVKRIEPAPIWFTPSPAPV